MEIDKLRQLAKSLKIRNWHNKKEENLNKEIAAIQGKEVEPIKLNTSDDKTGYLDRCGYNREHMLQYAKELGATRIIYQRKHNVFQCYKEEHLLDELTIDMF